MNSDENRIIVLARKYSTGLSVIRSLGAAGYTVDLLSSAFKQGFSTIAASSKYVNHSVEVVAIKDQYGRDSALLEEILKYKNKYNKKPVLFPADDYTNLVIDNNRSLLEKDFIMPTIINGKEGCLTSYKNRDTQKEIAKKAGFYTPLEWIISLNDKIEVPDDVVYPCFCKPLIKNSKYKDETTVCEDENELIRHLIDLRTNNSDRSIVVQEFLKIDNEIEISGVCYDDEVIIPAMIKKSEISQFDKQTALGGKILPLDEIKETIIDMMKELHYIGMFDIEVYYVQDKIYFNRLDLHIGESNYAYYKSGVNLPDILVKKMLGKEILDNELEIKEYGKNFVYEKSVWEDYIAGFITKKELNHYLSYADFRLLDDSDDPVPGNMFLKNVKKRSLRKKVKGLILSFKRIVYPVLRPIVHRLRGYPQTKRKNRRNPNADKPRVVVAGRSYSSNLCVARALGMAGYEVEVLRVFQAKPRKKSIMKRIRPDAYSQYVKAYHVCITRGKNQRIIDRLMTIADTNRKMLLLPVDDLVANTVDDYLEELSEYYIVSSVNDIPGEINRLMSKEVQKQMAKDFGLPVLNSCMIKTIDGQFEIPDTVNYPCFIKPNISKNGSKTKMKRIDSKEELQETLTEYSLKKDIEMLVEDYVEIGYEYSILGVSTKEGAIGPGFFKALEGGHGARRGIALCGEVVSCEQRQQLINDILRFIESLNYVGLFDVDLIETKDGKMYFVELNLRFGGSGYSITKSGVNLPGMYADYMILGKPIDLNCKLENPGKHFVNEKIMIDEFSQGYLTWQDVKEKMAKADIHFIQDSIDTKPYNHFKKFYPAAALARKIYLKKHQDD